MLIIFPIAMFAVVALLVLGDAVLRARKAMDGLRAERMQLAQRGHCRKLTLLAGGHDGLPMIKKPGYCLGAAA